jgi:heat shock protein HtpX
VLDPRTQRRQRVRNAVHSALLLGCLLVVVAGVGWLLFATAGLVWTLVAGGLVLALRPRVPPRLVLALYRAEPLPATAAPGLHRMLTELVRRSGLHHAPALCYVPSAVPNCFCVGHGAGAAVAVTDGLLHRLTGRELAGVLAHELGHLRAGDPAAMSLSDTVGWLCRALGLLAVLGSPVAVVLAVGGEPRLALVCAVLATLPVLVTLLQLALSRSREFDADLAAARVTGDPEGLACALEVLESTTGRIWERLLVGPSRVPDPLLLRTHPPTEERTRRLRALEPGDGAGWVVADGPLRAGSSPHVVDRPPRRLVIRW